MQIEDVALDQLSLDPLNARKHDRRNLDAIKASVLRFGIQKPIIALNSGTIIAGNGFFMVAKELGFKTVPVKRFEKPEDARAYAIADNRTAELSGWDVEQLVEGLEEFTGDTKELGFTLDEFADLKKELEKEKGSNRASFRDELNYKLTYELVFETHEEQKKFFDQIRVLNTTRTEQTVAARLLAFLQENLKGAE